MKRMLEKTIDKQKNKFERISLDKVACNNNPNIMADNNVFNLSNVGLKEPTQKIIGYGLNYDIALENIPIKELICDVENIVYGIPKEKSEELRQESAMVIRREKPLESNLSRDESMELKNLKNNKDIIILKADKGSTTVVLNTVEYERKMLEHLSTSSCRKLSCDRARILKRK